MDLDSLINKAKSIAGKAHSGQERKNGDVYMNHLGLVVEKVKEDKEAQVVAWLHDIIEDTDITDKNLLAKGIPNKYIEMILVLTKRREQTYESYITEISKHELAKKVKVADILANLSDNPGKKQIVKFSKALITLCSH